MRILLAALLISTATTFAEDKTVEYMNEIDEISQQLGRKIEINESQVGYPDVKLARAIRTVLTTIAPHMGPLKMWNGPLKFRGDLGESYLAYASRDGTYFNSEFFGDQEMKQSSYEANAAHELGHEILRVNSEVEDSIFRGSADHYIAVKWMLSPYHETFGSLNVLFFNGGDPTAEMSLSLDTGAAPKKAHGYRWDIPLPISREVKAAKGYNYVFFRAAKYQIWKKHLQHLKQRKDYTKVMVAFIRATDAHVKMRIARGELKMQTRKWTRRAPQINQEFVEIFNQEMEKPL